MFLLLSISTFLATFAFAQDELMLVQLVHRHGAKVPDHIPLGQEEFWARFGHRSHLTIRGEQQLAALGQLLRDRYITNEPLLPSTYDQAQLHVYASSANSRPLRSSEALVRSLYPGASIPIYTTAVEYDRLAAPQQGGTCPSFGAETPLLHEELSHEIDTNYTELVTTLRAVFDFPDERPSAQFIGHSMLDQYECSINHGLPLHPVLEENVDNMIYLFAKYWDLQLRREEPYDPRGLAYHDLVHEMTRDIEGTIDGTSPLKMVLYSDHGTILAGMRQILGILIEAEDWRYFTDTIILELRRTPQMEYYVRAEFLRARWLPDFEGVVFDRSPLLLRCPTPNQLECPVNPWIDYVRGRAPSNGCCERTRAFTHYGCDDYLNPDVLNIQSCYLYRRYCPGTACDTNQILDGATLLCVEIGKK